ncbi:hypothetical protein GCM10020255_037440 [Rhodococcus baikonurensis]
MTTVLVVLSVFVVLIAVLVGMSVRVLREYERAVVFRLGRLITLKGPGLVILVPAIDRMERVSLRTVTLKIPVQEVITRDNVPVKVTAVTYFRVVDADRSIVEVEDFLAATSQIAQTTLRSILGKAELDSLLSERERLNEDLQKVIDQQTEPWESKSPPWRSRTSRSQPTCSAPSPGRLRPNVNGEPRSSTPTPNFRLRPSSPRRPR